MPVRDIDDIDKLKKINAALISRVERSMDQQGNAFSLFQTAIGLENRVRSRTEELRATLRNLEQSNLALGAAKESAELANLSKTRWREPRICSPTCSTSPSSMPAWCSLR